MSKFNFKSGLLFATHLALVAVFAVIFFGLIITPANAVTEWHIKDDVTGGDCSLIGNWDIASKTCTLTQDLSQGIIIDSDEVTLDGAGHTIRGTGQLFSSGNGVSLLGRFGVTIKNLNVQKFDTGIFLEDSDNITLTGNTASNNLSTGINIRVLPPLNLFHRNFNVLTGNNALNNGSTGIAILNGNRDTLTGNIANSNGSRGIALNGLGNHTLTGNTASNNNIGILLNVSSGNTLTDNIVQENTTNDVSVVVGNPDPRLDCDNNFTNTIGSGGRPIRYFHDETIHIHDETFSELVLCNTDNSSIDNVTINGSATKKNNGLFLLQTDSSTITNSTSSNNAFGISLSSSNTNTIYHNEFSGNATQASVSGSGNIFNLALPTGGNHWDDYDTPTEGCQDANSDDFCDAPYVFSGGQDGAPHSTQHGPPPEGFSDTERINVTYGTGHPELSLKPLQNVFAMVLQYAKKLFASPVYAALGLDLLVDGTSNDSFHFLSPAPGESEQFDFTLAIAPLQDAFYQFHIEYVGGDKAVFDALKFDLTHGNQKIPFSCTGLSPDNLGAFTFRAHLPDDTDFSLEITDFQLVVTAMQTRNNEDVTCDDPFPEATTLTVIKRVVNDDDGEKVVSDFPLSITKEGVTTRVESGIATAVTTGTYTITETNASGYSASFSNDCDSSGIVTILPGNHKTCIITNDDEPTNELQDVPVDPSVDPPFPPSRVSCESSHLVAEDEAGFNFDLPTVLIVHGWNSSASASWVRHMRDFIPHDKANVLRYDWQKPANTSLPTSQATKEIQGKCLTNDLSGFLKNQQGLQGKHYGKKLQIIGHSAGAAVTYLAVGRLRDKGIPTDTLTMLDAYTANARTLAEGLLKLAFSRSPESLLLKVYFDFVESFLTEFPSLKSTFLENVWSSIGAKEFQPNTVVGSIDRNIFMLDSLASSACVALLLHDKVSDYIIDTYYDTGFFAILHNPPTNWYQASIIDQTNFNSFGSGHASAHPYGFF